MRGTKYREGLILGSSSITLSVNILLNCCSIYILNLSLRSQQLLTEDAPRFLTKWHQRHVLLVGFMLRDSSTEAMIPLSASWSPTISPLSCSDLFKYFNALVVFGLPKILPLFT